jgi:uncharacterized protein YecE (DUF72 family)
MVIIGCAGFPVPATRYFKEFLFVEVQETHLAVPGPGTIRRWRREAPAGFQFSVLGPREIGQEGFRDGTVVETALASLSEVAKDLGSTAAVFVSPPEFVNNRANKAAVKDFLTKAKASFEVIVWEAPTAWDPDVAQSLAESAGPGVMAARDPLAHGIGSGPAGYYRLPGPAGHKSRYEDPAIEKLAALVQAAKHETATYVFTNVDMFADAKRLRKIVKA